MTCPVVFAELTPTLPIIVIDDIQVANLWMIVCSRRDINCADINKFGCHHHTDAGVSNAVRPHDSAPPCR